MVVPVAERVDPRRRLLAAAALLLGVVTIVLAAVLAVGDVARMVLAVVLVLVLVGAGWLGATRLGATRWAALAVALGALAAVVVTVLGAEGSGWGLVVVALLSAATVVCSRAALSGAAQPVGVRVEPARHGALIMNPRSGGGKAERFHLEQEARRRGIEPIVLSPGDDLLELTRDAIRRGADVIGVAGGDGTQALVASVAMHADVAVVCVPAGTRNHFALDLGLDRDDVVGALDAFDVAVERRIDLATVNDRLFVNNVSLGVYARIVQSPEYRDAKRRTTMRQLPELLGSDPAPFDLSLVEPDGGAHDGAQIVLVSNNPYSFSLLGGFGTRRSIDAGVLGVSVVKVHGATQAAAAAAAFASGHPERFDGWSSWTTASQDVASSTPVEAGVDGEALLMDPPLEFRSLPGALRVRLPLHAPGVSPAASRMPSPWAAVVRLVAVAVHGEASRP